MEWWHLPELVHYLVAMDYRYTMIYTNNKGVSALCSVSVCIICCASHKCLNCWKRRLKKKCSAFASEAEAQLHLCRLSKHMSTVGRQRQAKMTLLSKWWHDVMRRDSPSLNCVCAKMNHSPSPLVSVDAAWMMLKDCARRNRGVSSSVAAASCHFASAHITAALEVFLHLYFRKLLFDTLAGFHH